MKRHPVIIIVGATGTGKTGLAAALCRRIGGEIISADSRQVYRFLDIGTNKEGDWDDATATRIIDGVPQHVTDLITPAETFSAGDFVQQARQTIERLYEQGKTPVVAGGSGVYVKALIDGIAKLPEGDPALRNELKLRIERDGLEPLYRELAAVDPAAAEKNRRNPQRLMRALEVFRLTGVPITEWQLKTEKPKDFSFVQFGLDLERSTLYERLDRRCERMIASGMIEETEKVLARGYTADAPGLNGIGYRHCTALLAGKLEPSTAIELFKRDTRRYAKRQVTWFKADQRVAWHDALTPVGTLVDNIVKRTGNVV